MRGRPTTCQHSCHRHRRWSLIVVTVQKRIRSRNDNSGYSINPHASQKKDSLSQPEAMILITSSEQDSHCANLHWSLTIQQQHRSPPAPPIAALTTPLAAAILAAAAMFSMMMRATVMAPTHLTAPTGLVVPVVAHLVAEEVARDGAADGAHDPVARPVARIRTTDTSEQRAAEPTLAVRRVRVDGALGAWRRPVRVVRVVLGVLLLPSVWLLPRVLLGRLSVRVVLGRRGLVATLVLRLAAVHHVSISYINSLLFGVGGWLTSIRPGPAGSRRCTARTARPRARAGSRRLAVGRTSPGGEAARTRGRRTPDSRGSEAGSPAAGVRRSCLAGRRLAADIVLGRRSEGLTC